MMLFLRICLCGGLLAAQALAFQQSAPPPPGSRPAAAFPRTPSSAITPPAFQRQPQILPSPASSCDTQHISSRLGAFGGGGGGGGFGQFGEFKMTPPMPPIETKKDILHRLQLIAVGTVKQIISGFTNGYLLALAWGVVRGPSLAVESRPLAWGLDFGVLSALFSCTNSVAELVLALPTKSKKGGKEGGGGGNTLIRKQTRQQKVALWSVMVRNMMLALYFGRSGSVVQMARSAALYGGLTYLFVGKKAKRDAARMSMFGGNGSMGGPGGIGGGQPPPDAMKQLIIQMMAAQNGQMPPPGTMGSQPPSSPKQASSPPGASSAKSAPSPLANDKEKSKRDNVVDVDFEKIDADEDGDAK